MGQPAYSGTGKWEYFILIGKITGKKYKKLMINIITKKKQYSRLSITRTYAGELKFVRVMESSSYRE